MSLLGAVASAGSIAVLTEMNLYNKTVEQVRQEQIYSDGAERSRLQALSDASRMLGGCPEELVHEIFGNWWFPDYYIQGESHGYAVLDAEGNVLESVNPELKTTGETHSFPVEGQYLHLVSEMSHSEKYPQTEEAQVNLYEGYLDGQYGVVDVLPSDGSLVAVYNITLGYADESGEGFGSIDPIGMIWRDSSGRVVFRSNQDVFLETG